MQLLDIILPSRLEMLPPSPRFDFEDSPEYKEMVKRATDSLLRIQDSIQSAAADTTQAVNDTLSSIAPPLGGGVGSDDGMSMLVNVIGSLATVALCAYAVYRQRKARLA